MVARGFAPGAYGPVPQYAFNESVCRRHSFGVELSPAYAGLFFGDLTMHRNFVNKGKSAKRFRRQVGKTKSINMKAGPMRGGIRL